MGWYTIICTMYNDRDEHRTEFVWKEAKKEEKNS